MSNNLESSLPGMPPQDKKASPNPDFDFMLKVQPQKPGGRLSSLGNPAKILIGAVIVLIIVTVATLVLSRGGNNSQQLLGLMAQSQEMIRVSQLQTEHFQDSNTKVLTATVVAAIQSQQAQLGGYLKDAGIKYGSNELAARTDPSTDTRLQTAVQNNNLDNTYISYLKNSLTTYLNSLATTYKTINGNSLKETLASAYTSVQTLLQSPQLKS